VKRSPTGSAHRADVDAGPKKADAKKLTAVVHDALYSTVWDTLDPLGLLHVKGESGLVQGT
jgi:hypothetical protein